MTFVVLNEIQVGKPSLEEAVANWQDRQRALLDFVSYGGDMREIYEIERAYLGGTLEELGFL
jgi:hypothetical protein